MIPHLLAEPIDAGVQIMFLSCNDTFSGTQARELRIELVCRFEVLSRLVKIPKLRIEYPTSEVKLALFGKHSQSCAQHIDSSLKRRMVARKCSKPNICLYISRIFLDPSAQYFDRPRRII